MSKLEIQYRVLGAIGTNVYFLINKETKETNKQEDEKKENENTQTDEHNQPTKGKYYGQR